ncbi:helix-turn-helix transcriptional regulator [Brevibacterium casei]|uniref:helix-turn-helix transcriptional regulator n=1 Tax=Brevibacterium casei TaxID=33889 RepID=UPI00223B73D6|nr:helix-turn-helix transcriptional regulator [Brevibacterium casei]MCT1550172.1 helix-turn-helix transcriptional regulator [Brevibacterium casei]MCT1560120.1 helix-turn-helix transcriptional regulator [Brevibacterium casei]MCT2208274.1 helix-turn-helix transcriptional regulator [Brevibacterium casei]
MSRDLEGFARDLGLGDSDERLAELFDASGGRLSLARTVLEIGEKVQLPDDLMETSFADYVASLTGRPDLDLSGDDEYAVTALAHLRVFTRQTALLTISSISTQKSDGALRDAEGLLMRLRMVGAIVETDEAEGRRPMRVPPLLAAKLRFDNAESDAGASPLITDLVGVLVEHLDTAQDIDTDVLTDVLGLARRNGMWAVLTRLSRSIGVPMFLLAPQATFSAFSSLPGDAIGAEPELGFMSRLTDEVARRVGDDSSSTRLREALVHETRSRRIRDLALAVGPDPDGPGVEGLSAFIRSMSDLMAAGRHAEAAEQWLATPERPGAKRAQLIVRLLGAICTIHEADYARALSLLRDVETQAAERHVEGDFLLPAALAWSALASAAGADNERTDRLLDRLGEVVREPTIVDDLVTPAWDAAMAVRSLELLELDSARTHLEALAEADENWGLSILVPVLGRTLAVLRATSESDLLFANDEAEFHRDDPAATVVGRDLVSAGRALVFTALGQVRWAQIEIDRLSVDSVERVVLAVRLELVAGRPDGAAALADTWFYHRMLTPAARAELAALKAAALLRLGDDVEAARGFRTAVGLSAWVGSLLPLALLPQPDRARLLELTADDPAWDAALTTFSAEYPDRQSLFSRLREVGAVTVSETSMPQLTDPESRLLDLLASGLSIAEISTELRQVPGTVKNRLSALYRKFGVSSRAEVVARASSLGFITPN